MHDYNTIVVTSTKWSLLKSRLLKSYLRSTISQSSLTLISFENTFKEH